jgi:hypothetical protein
MDVIDLDVADAWKDQSGSVLFPMNRPPYPSRLFSNEEDARAWLKTLRATE